MDIKDADQHVRNARGVGYYASIPDLFRGRNGEAKSTKC